jgi:integrase
MAGLSYYVRGAGGDDAEKTVVVRFTHNGTFDRATEAKAKERDLDKKTGVVNLKVKGSAEKNKEIDRVRSRFLTVLGWIEKYKYELSLESFKTEYIKFEKNLAVVAADEWQHKAKVTRNSIADDLYLEIARLEGELVEARRKLNDVLYPGGEREARLLSNVFGAFLKTKRGKALSEATKKNYGVTKRLMEREFPGVMVHELTKQLLDDLGERYLAMDNRDSSLGEHYIRLKAVVRYFADEIDPTLDVRYLKKVKAGASINDKPVIFLRPNELNALFYAELPKARQRYVRDLFLLSCYTGLRHVDLHFDEDNVTVDEYLEVFAQKTKHKFSVPYLSRAREVMQRLKSSDYVYKPQLVGNYTAEVKAICSLLPVFKGEKPVSLVAGSEKKKRWEMITSKVGRKTFINICMLAGVASDVVADWVGHKDPTMIHQHYKDHKAMSEQARKILEDSFKDITSPKSKS